MIKNIIIKVKENLKKMLDKKANNAYIWYSGATDVTGTKLAEALKVDHGRKAPDFSKYDTVIGWGTKLKEPLAKLKATKVKMWNDPTCILTNRDKLAALNLMNKSGVSVASFIDSAKASSLANLKTEGVQLPLIGRTKFHQGGKGFWICPTMTHVRAAIDDGARYFQNMIEIKDEYRLHIFDGKTIYIVKKTKRSKEEYQEAYVRHELELQKKLAEKNGNKFDEDTAKLMLGRMAKKKVAEGANMIIRSNKLGWKFSHVKTVNKDLEKEAIKALKTMKLNFGAVDCCLDVDNKPFIIEINTGPGLEETPFNTYVEAFRSTVINPPKETVTDKAKDPARAEKVKDEPNKKGKTSVREELLSKANLMAEMVSKANEDEAVALKGVFNKMFD